MVNHEAVMVLLERDLREIFAGHSFLARDVSEAISSRFVDTGVANSTEHQPVFQLIDVLYRVGLDGYREEAQSEPIHVKGKSRQTVLPAEEWDY